MNCFRIFRIFRNVFEFVFWTQKLISCTIEKIFYLKKYLLMLWLQVIEKTLLDHWMYRVNHLTYRIKYWLIGLSKYRLLYKIADPIWSYSSGN